MAHDVAVSPYPLIKAASDATDEPHFVLIKDAGGLYITESISEDPELLWKTACLFTQWCVDEMRQQHGDLHAETLLDNLATGLGLQRPFKPGFGTMSYLEAWATKGAGRNSPEKD